MIEPFTAENMQSDRIVDADGRPLGKLLAVEGGTDENSRIVMRLADEVREERLVNTEKVAISASHVHLENGAPRLDWTLDELLDQTDVSHSNTGNNAKAPERRPDHMGASTPDTRSRGNNESLERSPAGDNQG